MAELARAEVVIGGNDAPLQRALSRAEGRMQAAGQRMQAIGRTLTATVTLPIVAIGAASIKAAADFDQLRRGLTAVTGSADEANRQMRRLQDIAELPGIDFEPAAQTSIAFQAIGDSAGFAERMILGVGRAVAVSGGGAAEFKGVVRQLRQIRSLGRLMGEELNTILENAPAMATAIERAFGTTSAETIRNLNLSTEEFFERLAEGMESLPEVEGGVSNMFNNMTQALRRAGDAIGTALLPVVTRLVEGIARLANLVDGVDEDTMRWGIAISTVAAAAGPAVIVISSLTTAVSGLVVAGASLTAIFAVGAPLALGLAAVGAIAVKLGLDFLSAADDAEEMNTQLERSAEATDALEISLLRQFTGGPRNLAESIGGGLTVSVQSAAGALEDLSEEMAHINRLNAALGPHFDATSEKAKVLRSTIEAMTEEGFDPASRSIRGLRLQLDALTATPAVGVVGSAIAGTVEEMRTLGRVADVDLSDAWDTATSRVEDFGRTGLRVGESIASSFASAFSSVVNGTRNATAAFADFAKSVLSQLASMIARAAAFAAIASVIGIGTGGFGAIFGSILGGGGIPGLAHGGAVTAGQPHIVGEQGPEVFVPSSAGNVVPNNQMGGGSNLLANMPPLRRPQTPREAARDSWWREFIRVGVEDNSELVG